MTKTILTVVALTFAATALSACVVYSGGPHPRVIEERENWIPGHYDAVGVWVPGHWR